PTSPVPALHDPNPDGRSEAELREGVLRIAHALAEWARAAQQPLSVPWRFRRAGAVYGLTALLPDGAPQFSLDLRAAELPLRERLTGQLDREGRAVAWLAGQADRAPVRFDDPASDPESQAEATESAVRNGALELPEHA